MMLTPQSVVLLEDYRFGRQARLTFGLLPGSCPEPSDVSPIHPDLSKDTAENHETLHPKHPYTKPDLKTWWGRSLDGEMSVLDHFTSSAVRGWAFPRGN